ncbi:MAG: sensor histidine kinase [Ktedonobacteraceae bacterium]
MRQHHTHLSFRVSFFSSVKFRLILWYLASVTFTLFIFGGSFYAAQMHLTASATDADMETQLYQDAQRLIDTYKPVILHGQQPGSQSVTLSSQEIVLLLTPTGTILDTRGPLTTSAIRQLQAKAESSQPIVNMTLPLNGAQTWQSANGHTWQSANGNYRILTIPILDQNSRMAILMVGLARENQAYLWSFWLLHGIAILLVSTIGGYWLASKALRPVQMITRTANEINATDLRHRLHLQRKDEFGALAATFDQMLARLEAAFKRQTQFTADASHELRTPLTIIDLEINRALTQLQTPEEVRQVLEHICSENEQMTTIVNSLLLLARADTGQITLHKEEVDLSDLALASVERLLPLAQQSQVTLSTGKLPELLISGDPQYLSRMLINLVENAIKYTSGIGQRVHVELACEHEHWGVLRVQDDGPGIADEHLPSLFDRFYRVDKARTRRQKKESGPMPAREHPGGTGLGLAIVQWIVQAHGGEVRVESKMGVGSVFEVRLPLLKQDTQHAAC